ncbi:MAG: glycosyltransferase family 2 protein, partial [Bacillota bacterium]|nr:glycosyltransferase family 2 protein [Bacillota bacterium]
MTVLIPARNEAGRIGETVRAVREVGPAWEVIVIDDCSRDATAAQAREAGARVLSLPRHLGKGGALNHGLAESRGEIILLLDADLGRSAAQCTLLLQPVLDGRLDMAIARFPPPRRRGGFGLVKGLARWGIRLLAGLEMASPLSGQRAV